MKRLALVGAAVLAMGVAVPGWAVDPPHKGSGPTGAKCTHTSWFHHDPALTMEPSSGAMQSAEPGVLECDGVINGVAVSGPGTYTWRGMFGSGLLSEQTGGGNCLYGSGYGTFKGKLPRVDGGFLHVRGEFNFVRGLHGGPEWGSINGQPYAGFLRSDTPDVVGGECKEHPITRATIYSDFVVGGGDAD